MTDSDAVVLSPEDIRRVRQWVREKSDGTDITARLLATLDAARQERDEAQMEFADCLAARQDRGLLDALAKSLIRDAIRDAYFEAKDNGESLGYAHFDAARRVLEVLEGYGVRVAALSEADRT